MSLTPEVMTISIILGFVTLAFGVGALIVYFKGDKEIPFIEKENYAINRNPELTKGHRFGTEKERKPVSKDRSLIIFQPLDEKTGEEQKEQSFIIPNHMIHDVPKGELYKEQRAVIYQQEGADIKLQRIMKKVFAENPKASNSLKLIKAKEKAMADLVDDFGSEKLMLKYVEDLEEVNRKLAEAGANNNQTKIPIKKKL